MCQPCRPNTFLGLPGNGRVINWDLQRAKHVLCHHCGPSPEATEAPTTTNYLRSEGVTGCFVVFAAVHAANILEGKAGAPRQLLSAYPIAGTTQGCANEQISHGDDLKHASWLSNNVPKQSLWCAARPPLPSSANERGPAGLG